jgi:hypothetical protein
MSRSIVLASLHCDFGRMVVGIEPRGDQMPIGGNSRDIQLTMSSDEAFKLAHTALEQIGKVKDENPAERRIKGSIRYGLQKVLVKAHVEANGDVSIVSLKAQGDDVWGVGAKKVLERWAQAVEGSR